MVQASDYFHNYLHCTHPTILTTLQHSLDVVAHPFKGKEAVVFTEPTQPRRALHCIHFYRPLYIYFESAAPYASLLDPGAHSPIICLRGLTCPYLSGSIDLRSPFSQSLSNFSELLVDSNP
ncbi:hypothetical protein EYC84_009523 [Monilinia fructicola]|uniref:Uncharacterized protein n=1 Tax=Monilinia fructicola TaxID=38448 RepID=A0A5M9JBD2_MONFR|nr:hypothetical protein EYC84_009523 [Monilinia fructicola]